MSRNDMKHTKLRTSAFLLLIYVCINNTIWRLVVVGSIPTRINEIFNIFTSTHCAQGEARFCIPPLNTQCLHISAESEEWNVLTLGSSVKLTLLIFSVLYMAKRGVEFRYSTRNSSKIRRKLGAGLS